MRIISPKMHDYYDTALGQGADPTLVFVRKQEPGSLITLPLQEMGGRTFATEYYKVDSATQLVLNVSRRSIIFCGKYYNRAIVEATLLGPVEHQVRKFWFYSSKTKEAVAHMFEALVGDAEFDYKHAPTFNKGDYQYHRSIPSLQRRGYWNPNSLKKDKVEIDPATTYDWLPLHRQEGSPILELREPTHAEQGSQPYRVYSVAADRPQLYRVEKNPKLSEVGFQQVFPPFQAYQEIDMYLGGVMGNDGRPMVQLTDKEVLVKHGFDTKTSFRKPKESAK